VGVDPTGGGATAAVERRLEAQHYRRQASRAGAHMRKEEEERGGVRGTYLRFSESSRTSR
jgi:hypothetical protein